jgi:hypothetical protein
MFKPDDPIDLDGLSESTKGFLKSLRDEDIEEINNAMQMAKTIRTMGSVMKWVSITVVAIFVGVASLGDAFVKIRGYVFQVSGY